MNPVITATGTILALLGFTALSVPAETAQPLWAIQAITVTGDVHIAGSGETCAAATIGLKVPADWVEITCVRLR